MSDPSLARHGRGSPTVVLYQNPMGANLYAGGSVALSASNFPLFTDHIGESTNFSVATSPGSVNTALRTTTSATGWPTQDVGVYLHNDTTNAPQAWYYTGTGTTSTTSFACGFTGTGSETVTELSGAVIANVVHATNSTFDLAAPKTGTFGFTITGTTGGVTNLYCYLPAYRGGSLTFTSGLSIGATSATLSSNWTGTTGLYMVTFSDAETRVAELTNGGTAVGTWVGGLSGSVTSAASANSNYSSTKVATQEAINLYGQFAYVRWMWASGTTYNTAANTSSTRSTPSNFVIGGMLGNGADLTGVTLASAPSSGATGATLSAGYAGQTQPQGNAWINFSDNESREVFLMNGCIYVPSTTGSCAQGSWGTGLTNNVTTAARIGMGDGFPIEWVMNLSQSIQLEGGKTGIWINEPMNDDGTWLSSVETVLNANLAAGIPVWIELGNECFNGSYFCYYYLANEVSDGAFPSTSDAWSSLLHTAATSLRSVFGSRFGTDIRLVGVYQQNNVSWLYSAAVYYSSQGWNLASDLYATGEAPYGNASPALTTSDSIQTIENKFYTGSLTNAMAVDASEHLFVMGSHNGLSHGLAAYEAGWDVYGHYGGGGYTNVFTSGGSTLGAMQDTTTVNTCGTGMQCPWTTYEQGLCDAGYIANTQFTVGAWGYSTSVPGDEETAYQSDFINNTNVPILNGMQPFMTGCTHQRNVITARGQTIAGVNYLDNNSSISASNPALNTAAFGIASPYNGSAGPVSWLVWDLIPGTNSFSVVATISSTSTGSTWLETTGGTVWYGTGGISGGAISIPNNSGTPTAYTLGNVNLSYGENYILLGVPGTSQGNITVTQLGLY